MADYSLVEYQSGEIIGVYLRNPALAQNRNLLKALCIEEKLSDGVYAAVYSGSYRIEPNTSDDRGGCFVIWGGAHIWGRAGTKEEGKEMVAVLEVSRTAINH